MKFTITQDAFAEGLQSTISAVNTRSTMPILNNVLVRAEDNSLIFTATDLEFTMRTKVPAKVATPGATTLPARRLITLVKDLPKTEIDVDVDSKCMATLRGASGVYKIFGLPEVEFPGIPSFDDAIEYRLKAADIKDALRKTHYAISVDETRFVLNGVYFSFKDGKLVLVATDGRRLALAEVGDLEIPASREKDFIVRTKAIFEFMRILKDEGEAVIRLTQNLVQFECGNTSIISKLVDGNYPNYLQVIPTKVNERITVEREVLLGAVHRVSLLSTDKSNPPPVKLSFNKDNIEVVSNIAEVGEARETVPTSYKGKEISVSFNPDFLMAPLRNLQEDEIHFEFIDEASPGVIKVNTPFVYVLMPLRSGGA